MPVPVPRYHKLPAHPVIKKRNYEDGQPISFQSLTSALPVSRTGPPPSFGTREEWIQSLPSWRRTKARRIWEDDSRSVDPATEQGFCQGLAFADNASVIKGNRAEACVPPLYTLVQDNISPVLTEENDDEMSSPSATLMDCDIINSTGQWCSSELKNRRPHSADASYERGAFTPVFEDQSPEHGDGSSPLGPATPVNDFMSDGCVQVNDVPYGNFPVPDTISQDYIGDVVPKDRHGSRAMYLRDLPKEPVPAPAPEVITPTATTGYRKLAEPLSEWTANYVWKLCTTNISLPAPISREICGISRQYPSYPPTYLSASVHSLLLSTLLQPSAVFLAMWYIARLPIYFGVVNLSNDKELLFRNALLGEDHHGQNSEANAPFQLIVLGCMLANKWLDDHTFSNKTWHTISNVPIQTLNSLESLALDIFSYDLSVSSAHWTQWLSHVMSYHMSLTSPSHPQPIGRPSANPHSIVRKAIDEIVQVPPSSGFTSSKPQPVFLGLEERRREKLEKEVAMAAEAEIDLDEDGPLREEYVPKRRISGAMSLQSTARNEQSHGSFDDQNWRAGERGTAAEKNLPPPAKWSPAGDEPILRERNRINRDYIAVQPPTMSSYSVSHHHHEVTYAAQQWPVYKPHPVQSFVFGDMSTYQHAAPVFNQCLVLPVAMPHSRSQSLSYDHDNSQSRNNHLRSYSQSRFDYRCSDIRMAANESTAHFEVEPQWLGHYAYPAHPFLPQSTVGYPSAWLRT